MPSLTRFKFQWGSPLSKVEIWEFQQQGLKYIMQISFNIFRKGFDNATHIALNLSCEAFEYIMQIFSNILDKKT